MKQQVVYIIKLIFLTILIVFVLSFDTHSFWFGKTTKEKKMQEPPDSVIIAPSLTEPSKSIQRQTTYLDTLNRGREVAITDADLANERISQKTYEIKKPSPELTRDFKIQCMASSDISRLRIEKRNLEQKTGMPAFIKFDSPYYKLLVGNFSNRNEAEKELVRIKNLGYTDAWIVRLGPEALSEGKEIE